MLIVTLCPLSSKYLHTCKQWASCLRRSWLIATPSKSLPTERLDYTHRTLAHASIHRHQIAETTSRLLITSFIRQLCFPNAEHRFIDRPFSCIT